MRIRHGRSKKYYDAIRKAATDFKFPPEGLVVAFPSPEKTAAMVREYYEEMNERNRRLFILDFWIWFLTWKRDEEKK